jgi:hypothetical protein
VSEGTALPAAAEAVEELEGYRTVGGLPAASAR